MIAELFIGFFLRIACYSLDLSNRPELNSISNSFEKLIEDRYSQNQSILGKALFWLVGQETHSWFVLLCFCDLASAQLIGSIGKIQFESKSKWFIWAWLNPLAIIATGGLSQGSISNTVILACWFLTLKSKNLGSSLFLILASMDRFYPIQLLIPIIFITKSKSQYLICLALWTIALTGTCQMLGISSWSLIENWNVIWDLSEYEPGLNYSWYMLIELFDHFREFFVKIIQVQMFCYVIPLMMRFDAAIALKYLIPIIYAFSPYSSISDVALLISILPLFHPGRRQFFAILVIITSVSLCPIMWYLWAGSMAGNANFYFATSLAVITGSILLIHDSLFAQLTLVEKSGLMVRLERPKYQPIG